MKKVIALVLAMVMVLGMVACSSSSNNAPAAVSNPSNSDAPQTATEKEPLNIMMYVIQSLGTLSCEDLIYEEVVKFCEETGSTLNTFECNSDETAHETNLREIAGSGAYDIIITGYWSIPEYVQMIANEYPEQKWLIFDTEIDYTQPNTGNIASFTAEQNTLAFMAGVLAAKMTTSNYEGINGDKVVSWVGGGENTAVNDFLVGFIDGVNYVDSEIEVLYSYVGDWANSAKAKELALTHYEMGADVCFTVCGGAGFGACEAAYETGHYAFGVDTDFAATLEAAGSATADNVVTSAIKQFGYIIYDALVAAYNGTLEWGVHTNHGVSSGYLEMIETPQFNTVVKEGMPEAYAEYTQIVEDLMAGKIEVGTAVGATEEYVNQKKAEAAPF